MGRKKLLVVMICLIVLGMLAGCASESASVQMQPESAAVEETEQVPASADDTAKEEMIEEQQVSEEIIPEEPALPPMEPAEQIRMLGIPVQLQKDGGTRFVPVKNGDAYDQNVLSLDEETWTALKEDLREQDGISYAPLDRLTELIELEQGETEAGIVYYAKRISIGEVPEGVKVPILMYHAVSDDCWGYSDLFVSPSRLEEQLAWMTENGYDAIWMEDLCHLEDYDKPVVLTFDDGYDDNYTELFPLLQKYNVKATVFVIAGSLGQPHKMTAEQVTELSQSGLVSIQSHSMTHPYLNTLTQEQLEWELGESQRIIASLTGKIPNVLCYPSGGFNQLTIDVAKQYYDYGMRMAGYLYNTSVDPFRIQRFYISRQSPLSDFQYYIKQTDQ